VVHLNIYMVHDNSKFDWWDRGIAGENGIKDAWRQG
jgi:hypothetical protein